MKKCIALLLIVLISTIPSFAINSNVNNVLKAEMSNDTLDLENYLNTHYNEKTIEGKNLKFKYELKEFADYLGVKMRGQDFHKGSSELSYNDSYFQKLIEALTQEINKNLDKNVSFYIYDDENNVIAKYKYSNSDSIIKKIYNDLKDYNVYDLENDLNRSYSTYGKEEKELEFEYESKNTSNYVMVTMAGKNFSHYGSSWKNRDIQDFRNFVSSISEEITNEFRKDVHIDIYSESRKDHLIARYEFRENKGGFIVISEDGEKVKADEINNTDDSQEQSLQNDGTYAYLEGRYNLKFKTDTKKVRIPLL